MIFIFTAFMVSASGCSTIKQFRQEKAQKQKEKAIEKAEHKEYKSLKKAHYQSQSDETRRMMKASQKRSKKWVRPRRRPYW